MIISGMNSIEKKIGCKVANDTVGTYVEKVVGCVESFDPEGWW